MKAKHVLPLKPESFILLVQSLRNFADKADLIELWLDEMRVKGDLKVIINTFKKPFIGKSASLDMLKRASTAGMEYLDVPHDLKVDNEFLTLVTNKKTKIIRSYHNFEETPSKNELIEILNTMQKDKPNLLKIATFVKTQEDAQTLLDLLSEPQFKDRLIITGMGNLAREVRIKAPLLGSIFYYAPVKGTKASAPGQLTKEELEKEWEVH
ncbi:MAG: type I 3-dehydroquinate dehydratase [Candidatus Gracilibacteria bacterium]